MQRADRSKGDRRGLCLGLFCDGRAYFETVTATVGIDYTTCQVEGDCAIPRLRNIPTATSRQHVVSSFPTVAVTVLLKRSRVRHLGRVTLLWWAR